MEKIAEFLRKIAKPSLYVVTIILMILFGWVLWETYQANNFGFASKTFWDWMELFLVPAALAAAGLWFSHVQKQTELVIAEKERETDREIALERQQQQTLEHYLDRMKELLLDRELGPEAKPEVKRLARTWTLNVLRELTAKRNKQVVQFLQESELVGRKAIVDLREADLAEVDLRKANLSGVNLSSVNLSNADLSNADLSNAKLQRANLHKANLRWAVLEWMTNLSNANLHETDLSNANLHTAIVSNEQLSQAILSDETIMPDGSTYQEWQQKQVQSQEQPTGEIHTADKTTDINEAKVRLAEPVLEGGQELVDEGRETAVSDKK